MTSQIEHFLEQLDTVIFLLAGKGELKPFGERAEYSVLGLPDWHIDLLAELHRQQIDWELFYIDELRERNTQLSNCETELHESDPSAKIPPLRSDIRIVGAIQDGEMRAASHFICLLTSRLSGSIDDKAYFVVSITETSYYDRLLQMVDLRSTTDKDLIEDEVEIMSMSQLLKQIVGDYEN
jgi:hypothetical protein